MEEALRHRTSKVVARGAAWPLGATPTATGVNFALYSQHASAVFLLLFDVADGEHEVAIDPPDHYIVNPHSVVMLLAR
jgi:pullulanase/glycogen debranching enzyme